MELSKRLYAVASMVTKDSVTADIGCDHGYVSIWLVHTGRCKKVIAMDVRKGPLSAAEEHIKEYGLSRYIETRLSDGVEALAMGEVQTMLAAGMGGRLMVKLLKDGADKVAAMQELVLQPQSDLPLVRRYLREQGFAIAEENMVCEDGKFYPMFRVLTKNGMKKENTECDADGYVKRTESERDVCLDTAVDRRLLYDIYGKFLLAIRHPVLSAYLEKEQKVFEQIAQSVMQNAGKGKEARLHEVEERQLLLKAACSFYA